MNFETYGLVPYGQVPNERQLAHIKMEKKAFIHFGVNTFTGKEWGLGDETESLFNPECLDARQWIKVVKDAGCKIAILTAKHHDGFCLWPSKYTEHTVARSPYKNGNGDVVREFVDACREYGVKAGIYISPWDRSVKEWGTPEYSKFFNNQLTELLSEYGRIDEVWWDGAGSGETEYDYDMWAATVHTLQPTAAIFGGTADTADLRWVGNEKGVAGTTHFGSLEIENLAGYPAEKLNRGHQNGNKYIYSESDVSIRPGWFYHSSQDRFVKNPKILDNIWFTSVGRNSNLLLNFPPDQRGLIHHLDAEYARISNENIEKMRSVNLLDGAVITADTQLCEQTSALHLISGGEYEFYASAKGTKAACIDVVLKEKKHANVMIFSEVVELGERINYFRIDSVENGKETTLFEGTSIGHCRAVKIPDGVYEHLRITFAGEDSIVLRSMSLNLYEEPDFAENKDSYGINLLEQNGGGVTLSDGGCRAVLAFGGIFEFNTVRADVASGTKYCLYVFDGTNFVFRTEGVESGDSLCIRLPQAENGSYQIKLAVDKPFPNDAQFSVSMESVID